ncbi:hypothetical protein [Micromonospora eburnea]|uniref:MmyB family transcriptional regulator n=1 Tax=Micromonospora eburnea TaxID=227316 RepID=UPI003629C709
MWAEGSAAAHRSLVLTVHHPDVGDITVDSDTLTVPDADLKVVVLTGAAGSEAAERLERLRTAT